MVQKNENTEEERFHMPFPDELTAFLIRELTWARKIGVSYDEGSSIYQLKHCGPVKAGINNSIKIKQK